VIDVLKNPQLAEEDKILATPTLAKILPPPVRRIIGDLSDRERVLIGLDLLYEELVDEGYSLEEPRLESVPDPPKELPLTDQQGDPMTSA
jgi:circadian clock protein KaiB